jgi:hypothetical protein
MRTERPACSEADSAGSDRRVGAPWSEPVSRSASEPESASLRKARVASLPEKLKPAIRREGTFISNVGALRGERGQCAGKVRLGSLGDAGGWPREEGAKGRSEDISWALAVGESERPIVAKKRGKARGAKGPWHERSGLRKPRS